MTEDNKNLIASNLTIAYFNDGKARGPEDVYRIYEGFLKRLEQTEHEAKGKRKPQSPAAGPRTKPKV